MGSGGLLYNINYVIMFNAILPSLISFIDPAYIVKHFIRKIEMKNIDKSVLTQ